MAKNIKKKTQNKPVYMTISEANAHNAMTPNNAFMIGIGTEDSPEFLYPEGLQPAIVTSSKKESDYKQAQKEASTFRNRSLAGHIGTGLGLDLGDKSLQNIAATAIGIPLVSTNPATTTLMKPLIKGVGHVGKVLLDPTKALTGVGQATATTADIYGTIEGLRQVPNATKNIIQGNGTAMDYFNLATGLMGPFGTFNALKAARFNPYLRQVAGYKNLGLEDGDRLNHIEQTTNNVRTPADDPIVQRMHETQRIYTQQMINQSQRAEDDLLDWFAIGNEPEITPFRPNINFGNNGTQNSIRQSTNNRDVIDELASQIHIDPQNIVPTNIRNEIDEIFETANRNNPYSPYFARKEFMTELRNKGLITQYLQKEIGKSINDIVGNYFYDGKKFINKSEVINELKSLGHSDSSINKILSRETDDLVRFIQGSSRNFDFPTLRIREPSFNEATHAKRIKLAHLEDTDVINHLFEDNGALRQGGGKGIYTKKDYNFTNEDVELLEQLVNNYNKSTNNNISVTDVLNNADNMADLRNYLRNNYSYFGVKGTQFPGDINHMVWFQAGNSSGYRPTNNYKKVTNQVNRDVSDLIASIPRGYALGETNTSFDSEMLKLLHTLKNKNYGRGKGQISIEFNKDNHGIVIDSGNSSHKERIFVKDLYDKYKDKLSETDKEVLEEIINRGERTKLDKTKELAKNISPELENIIKSEYDNLGKILSTKMQNVWDRLIQKDQTLKDAPKIFPSKFNEYKLLDFISEGNITPHINRPSIRIQKNKYGGNNKFKFGGMKQNKVFKLNGGVAVPLDDKKRLFYLSGAKHEQGGIDIGKNLEVEGGEVIKVNPKSIKVVTAQKIMGGKSPAELVVNASSTGEQDKVFNKVFKYQEDFKDRYNLNDDGTQKAKWGIFDKIKNSNIVKKIVKSLSSNSDNSDNSDNYYEFDDRDYNRINNDIVNGEYYLYNNKSYNGKDINKFFKKNDKIIKINASYNGNELMKNGYEVLPYEELRKMLPKRDYIGGNKRDVGIKVINKVPGLKDEILKLSKTYGISPNVFTNRLINEGWIQDVAYGYNRASSKNQKEYRWNIMNDSVSGFGSLGLDTFGNHHKAGHLNLRRDIKYKDTFNTNEDGTGRVYNSAIFDNMYDALEAKAAMIEYFTKLGKNKGHGGSDLDAWVNAAYNMGEYHKDLNNMDYVRQKYGVKPYYRYGGQMKKQYRINGTTNVPSTDRKLKAKLGLNTGDYINLGLNSAGALTNLITGLATPNIRYARMKDATPIIAPKINANVNTNAEESAIDQQYYDELNAINENTSNSQVALNRKRNAAAIRANAKLKVRAAAENTRRDLINKGNILKGEYDKFNIQRQDQIDAYNAQADAAEFNANRTKVGDAITGFVSDLGLGASTITNAIEKREADRINTVLSYMGNPEVNPDEFNKGFDDIYMKLYGKKPSNYLRKKYSKR